jgi:hypothetical protein
VIEKLFSPEWYQLPEVVLMRNREAVLSLGWNHGLRALETITHC